MSTSSLVQLCKNNTLYKNEDKNECIINKNSLYCIGKVLNFRYICIYFIGKTFLNIYLIIKRYFNA